MEFNEDDIRNSYVATLLSTERITPAGAAEVRHLVLKLPPGEFAFSEGQSVAALIPGPHEFGNLYHVRLYGIASSRSGEAGKSDTSPSACAAASPSIR